MYRMKEGEQRIAPSFIFNQALGNSPPVPARNARFAVRPKLRAGSVSLPAECLARKRGERRKS